ncbi:hypothetical protein QM012_005516 [Aureobasidium pullulans]|uniref:BTB domain-containing protein n=1 Tax=Aureobasidium pullulans TaxID=5580 RepID=A0ABR0T612_AURPU
MRYTYDIYQWCIYNCCETEVFLDMNPEALKRHSAYFRWLLSTQLNMLPWQYRSPAKRFKELHLHPLQHWMHEHALRYVLCAINRAKHGKKIFLELPESFALAVRVYQVVVFLQVDECIAPLHGHIRQVIRERPLLPLEIEEVWSCLSDLAPKIYEFALTIQYERERQVWLLGPGIEEPEQKDELRGVQEDSGSSGEETVIGTDPNQDTGMTMDAIDTTSEVGYTAEDEASVQELRPLSTLISFRRRSLPTPSSARMYDIDTSDFRECADEEPEY